MKPRIIPPVYFILFVIVTIIGHFFLPIKIVLSPPFTYAGLIVFLAGQFLAGGARSLFQKKNLTVKLGDELTSLEASGPFRFSRNPMYLGMTLMLLGGAVGLGSLSAFVGPVAFWLVVNFVFVPLEERKLEAAFGKQYQDYKRQVRRWF